jgi:hypothetical protein
MAIMTAQASVQQLADWARHLTGAPLGGIGHPHGGALLQQPQQQYGFCGKGMGAMPGRGFGKGMGGSRVFGKGR